MENHSKSFDLTDLEIDGINEELAHRPTKGDEFDNTLLFGKFSIAAIEKLFHQSGLIQALGRKGYKTTKTLFDIHSLYDQRILLYYKKEIIVHIRLKLADFNFKNHTNISARKLLYIDWLQTRDIKKKSNARLFPGQDVAGLGVFQPIVEIITNIARGLHTAGAFNMPEYFHDALLFHRHFKFYNPIKEAQFRIAIRDLRSKGARAISNGFSNSQIYLNNQEVVNWAAGEMLSITERGLYVSIFSKTYFKEVSQYLVKNSMSMNK